MSACDETDGLYTLAALGIAHSTDDNGHSEISIEFDANRHFGMAQCRAIFDVATKRWNLVTVSQTKFADGSLALRRRPKGADQPEVHRTRRPSIADWTDALPQTAHVEFFKDVDWGTTYLGPLRTWGPALRLHVSVLFADSRAAVLYWGPQKVAICNEFAKDVVARQLQTPTDLMGAPFATIFPALAQDFAPMFESVARAGVALDTIDVPIFPERGWGIEECYFSGQFLPLKGDSGQVEGFYNRAVEVTKENIRQRRSITLNAIASRLDSSAEFVWEHVFKALAANERDFPAALAYSVAATDSSSGQRLLRLEQTLGIPKNHAAVPAHADLHDGKSGFLPYFRKAGSTNRSILLHTADGSLHPELTDGFAWRGFGEASKTLAIIPVSASDRLFGFLVFGLNPRRPCDSEYEGFLADLSRQVSSTVASAADHEGARKREARLAQQLEDSEKQIRDLAEYAPVGISRLSPNGLITWANPQFYDITGIPSISQNQTEMSFMDSILEDDRSMAMAAWSALFERKEKVSVAARMQRKWTPPASLETIEDPAEEHAWVLSLAYPIIEDGVLTSVASTVTDISVYKWAESVQARIADAAKEAKRLQENFIGMLDPIPPLQDIELRSQHSVMIEQARLNVTSHEMRNPLSAITQCADGIAESLDELLAGAGTIAAAKKILKSNVEAANIVLLCADHQKRIIDDVLTLSKLDSMMLSITPIAVQPARIVELALKMFEAEFVTHKFEVSTIRLPSYHDFQIDWVYLDPSRLTQILANLLTNAIKFTKMGPRRAITVHIGASLVAPPTVRGVRLVPTNRDKPDLTQRLEWGTGEPVFVHFAVTDTGKGLEEHEITHLFNRFQQANPKTHVKYGGSGLGLFISRELTEMQGGMIGLCSTPGKSSTFAFYIKARRAESQVANPASPDVRNTGGPSVRSRVTRPIIGQKRPLPVSETKGDLSGTAVQRSALQSVAPVHTDATLCILLVEDNLVNSKVLSNQLRKAGHSVLVANHGVEALDFIQKSRAWQYCEDEEAPEIDVVLMDIEMPVMDGLTCTRRIRQLEQTGHLTKHFDIIAITANAREEQMTIAREAGMDDVMPKPFKVAELLKRVWQHKTSRDPP